MLGIGVIHIQGKDDKIQWQLSRITDQALRSNIYCTELEAILEGVWYIQQLALSAKLKPGPSYILSDSQSALKVLKKPQRQSGQTVIKKIIQVANLLNEKGFWIHF